MEIKFDINWGPVVDFYMDEFEEPRDVFILLVYFKEVCKLKDFESVAVIETLA